MKRVAESIWMPQRADGRTVSYREVVRDDNGAPEITVKITDQSGNVTKVTHTGLSMPVP